MLPIHDANGLLLDELARIPTTAAEVPPPDFAAVCLSDPFRRIDDVFDTIRAAGIGGIINLPSIVALMTSFGDRTFGALYDRECRMLDHASAAGFHVVRVVYHDDKAGDGQVRHADPDSFAVDSTRLT